MLLPDYSNFNGAVFIPSNQVTVTVEATDYGCLVTRSALMRGCRRRRVTRRVPVYYAEMDFLLEQLAAAKAERAARASAACEVSLLEGDGNE